MHASRNPQLHTNCTDTKCANMHTQACFCNVACNRTGTDTCSKLQKATHSAYYLAGVKAVQQLFDIAIQVLAADVISCSASPQGWLKKLQLPPGLNQTGPAPAYAALSALCAYLKRMHADQELATGRYLASDTHGGA